MLHPSFNKDRRRFLANDVMIDDDASVTVRFALFPAYFLSSGDQPLRARSRPQLGNKSHLLQRQDTRSEFIGLSEIINSYART